MSLNGTTKCDASASARVCQFHRRGEFVVVVIDSNLVFPSKVIAINLQP